MRPWLSVCEPVKLRVSVHATKEARHGTAGGRENSEQNGGTPEEASECLVPSFNWRDGRPFTHTHTHPHTHREREREARQRQKSHTSSKKSSNEFRKDAIKSRR
mmetsp:Transcript_26007/g.50999  ORF Transcript_26007/g.50999 Transcript_26007/m.50999 type:complete len:104 (-) Transcript_26007:552-863(-)